MEHKTARDDAPQNAERQIKTKKRLKPAVCFGCVCTTAPSTSSVTSDSSHAISHSPETFPQPSARNLLLYSDHSVSRIPELCGFSSLQYFTRTYRELTCETPSETKKSTK
ncbi:MAG: helix-turn-helix domain-containing protein [Ruminococcaceae bacterium]|nr:helix-turn-helix domain-containing protein [Oscillospiraceae bacterium]